MRTKVCGITRQADAELAARLGADFVGLLRAPGPRQVSVELAAGIARALPPSTMPVLVFQDASADEVCRAIEATGARWAQLHGREPPVYVRQLVERCAELNLIRAWPVAGIEAAEELRAYLDACAAEKVVFRALILDAPKGGVHPGYDLLGAVSRRCAGAVRELWCAGGLTVGNVQEAVRAGCYTGVDVARGVECSPGVKDPALLERFIKLAKSVEPAA